MAPRDSAPLVLASASPRRLSLLGQLGIEPAIVEAAMIDETPRPRELPAAYARRMAAEKAAAVAPHHPGTFLLAADTVVALGRRILPKAKDRAEAGRMLAALSGRRHRVYGGLCVLAPSGRTVSRLVITQVAFKRLHPAEIEAYLDCDEWRDKAGAYAIQGRAAAFVRRINGSYGNVVGLPLFETWTLLQGLGFAVAPGTGGP